MQQFFNKSKMFIYFYNTQIKRKILVLFWMYVLQKKKYTLFITRSVVFHTHKFTNHTILFENFKGLVNSIL